jgi:hypothetical protein
MATIKSQIDSEEVHQVQEQFERWRSGKEGREQIPPRLWGMAARLCETYSLNRVARCLRLNYTALKVEFDRRSHQRRGRVAARAKPAFVEWNLPTGQAGLPAEMVPGTSSAEYVVEVPDSRKGTPRIVVRGANAVEVAALVRALRDGGQSLGA